MCFGQGLRILGLRKRPQWLRGQRSNPDLPSPTFCFFVLRRPGEAWKAKVVLVPLTPPLRGKWILEVFQQAETRRSRPPEEAHLNLKGNDLKKKKTTLCRFTKHGEKANRVRLKRKASNEENLAFRVGVSSHNPSVLDQCCRLLP